MNIISYIQYWYSTTEVIPPHSLKKKAFIQIVSVFLAQPPPKNPNLFVNDGIFGGKKRTVRTKKKKNPKYF